MINKGGLNLPLVPLILGNHSMVARQLVTYILLAEIISKYYPLLYRIYP